VKKGRLLGRVASRIEKGHGECATITGNPTRKKKNQERCSNTGRRGKHPHEKKTDIMNLEIKTLVPNRWGDGETNLRLGGGDWWRLVFSHMFGGKKNLQKEGKLRKIL